MNRPRSDGGTNLVILLVVPAVVSLIVTLGILRLWDSRQPDVVILPTYSPTSQRAPREVAEASPGTASDEREEIGEETQAPDNTTSGEDCENPTHVVQAGQTTGSIAQEYGVTIAEIAELNQLVDPNFNPDFISVQQEILIPLCGIPTPTPTPEPSTTPPPTDIPPIPTATNPPPGTVEISVERVLSAGDVTEEAVEILNEGSPVNLFGWVLTDGDEEYEFPRLVIFSGSAVTLYTGAGTDDPRSLYWGLNEALWEPGDTIELYDADGDLVDSLTVPEE